LRLMGKIRLYYNIL